MATAKTANAQYRVEPLWDQHDRAAFSCGVEALDRYFHENVTQDISRRTAAAFVLTGDGVTVAGFYTLSSLSLLGVVLPTQLAKRLPARSPIGVTLLGRMGVEQSLKGKGLGELLLMDALRRAWQASREVASWAVVVDAKLGAREFYLKYDFVPLVTQPGRLFLPMMSMEKVFAGQNKDLQKSKSLC
jgi:GNAT superfamily N-acetyltransferase